MPARFRTRALLTATALSSIVVLASALEGVAHAQSPSDAAAAQALFDDGKRLMKEGNFATACPKLVESQRLDPGGGTVLAVALCFESAGKTASAWSAFNEAAAFARKDKRADREKAALTHIKDLEPKLIRLRITVATKAKGQVVRRDDVVVGDAQFDTALPVDPGEHVLEASAPEKVTWTSKLMLDKAGTTTTVPIPALEDAKPVAPPPVAVAPAVEPPKAAPPPVAPRNEPAPPPPAEPSFWTTQRTWGGVIALMGVGIAGVGAGFGIAANSKWASAAKACVGGCKTVADQNAGKSAGTLADVSTVLVIAGATGFAVGTVLFATGGAAEAQPSPRAVRVTPLLSPQFAGASVGGAF